MGRARLARLRALCKSPQLMYGRTDAVQFGARSRHLYTFATRLSLSYVETLAARHSPVWTSAKLIVLCDTPRWHYV